MHRYRRIDRSGPNVCHRPLTCQIKDRRRCNSRETKKLAVQVVYMMRDEATNEKETRRNQERQIEAGGSGDRERDRNKRSDGERTLNIMIGNKRASK